MIESLQRQSKLASADHYLVSVSETTPAMIFEAVAPNIFHWKSI